jgi:DNA-binding winged helix-turn-helix (wHTH) protein
MLKSQFYRFWRKPLKKIEEARAAGKTITVIGVYGMGQTLLSQIILDKPSDSLKIFINLKDIPLFSSKDIYKIVYQQLNDHLPPRPIKTIPSSDFEFHYYLRETLEINPHLQLYFIIQDGQHLLHLPDSFFDALEQLRYRFNPRVAIVLFGEPQLYYVPPPGAQRLIKNNYYFLQPYDRQTILAEIRIQEKRLKARLYSKRNFILKYSQGHHGTIKFLCQKIAIHHFPILNRKTFMEFINDEPLLPLWFQTILNSLTHKQQLLIYQYLVNNNLTSPQINSLAFKDLVRLGLFRYKRNKISFLFTAFNKKLNQFFKQKPSEEIEALTIKDNLIYLKGFSAQHLFNPQETRLLKGLLENRDRLLTYDQLGEIIWGRLNEKRFSLWAINKLISRLRKKFILHGLPKGLIQTIPKQGYLLST